MSDSNSPDLAEKTTIDESAKDTQPAIAAQATSETSEPVESSSTVETTEPVPTVQENIETTEPTEGEKNTAATETTAAENVENTQQRTDGSGKFCILIVEEKAELRSFYLSALTKTNNYYVKNSANPTEAFAILEKDSTQINMILFDWVMPEMSGAVFCQKIRDDSRFNHIEMIICSSDLDQEDSFLLVEMDVHNVMKKLTNANEFVAKIDEARSNYQQNHETVTKLKNLQALLYDIQVEQCEELLKNPEIEKEVKTNPKYVHLGGEILILKRQYEEAVEFLKQFLTKNFSLNGTENLKSLSTLGKALCLNGKFYDALLIFQRLESKSPRNLAHKIMSGDALLGMEKVDEAENKYNEVLKEDPENKDALVGMAKASALNGDFDASKTFFSKVEGNFESRTLASFFNNRGVAFVRQGNVQKAISFYENALQFLDKFKGRVYFNLGMAYYRVGDITKAVQSFQEALNSKEASQMADKTILKELQEKGADVFIAEYNSRQKK